MTCEDALILISGHLDGMNSEQEAAQLREHLDHCSACRDLLEAFRDADAGLLSMKEQAPVSLCEDVMSVIRAETGRNRRRHWRNSAVAAGLVAVIGIAAVSTWPKAPSEMAAPMAARSIAQVNAEVEDDPAWDPEYGLFTYDASIVLDPQTLADARSADLVVTHELLPEMENCACEILENGTLLYELESGDSAVNLSRLYGVELFQPADYSDATVSYALLTP